MPTLKYLGVIQLFFTLTCFAQVDNVGSGRAIQLDGIDDRVDVGDHYHDLNLPFTISAWVNPNLDPGRGMPIFVTNDNNPTYRGFWLVISQSVILCEFGDGAGGNNSVFRRGKSASISIPNNAWANITAVMKSPTDISLYLNGFNMGGSASGGSTLTMASSFPGDIAKIGYFLSNGVAYHGKGTMDEVRLWNRALNEFEIRDMMCRKLTGNEAGLIGYWSFDETSGNTVFDKSSNQFHGALVGNPQRVYSGAPVGDASTQVYTSNWSNVSLSLSDGGNTLTASAIAGSPWGAHIYRVNAYPSQSGGLNAPDIQLPYFGVFLASSGVGGVFQANYTPPSTCSILVRASNNVSNWVPGTPTFTNRTEIVKQLSTSFVADLGPDETLCDVSSKTLNAVLDPANKTFSWSTGATSPTINVSTSGTYWVTVTQSCQVDRDTIQLVLLKTPLPVSLGEDKLLCDVPSTDLTVSNVNGDAIEWNTGSNQSSIQVAQSGQFWVEIKNACGTARDTVILTLLNTPEALNLGDDILTCEILDLDLTISYRDGYEVEWNTGSDQPTIHVTESGQYWVEVKNACGLARDTITLTSLVLDVDKIPNVITPNGDDKNEFFVVEKPLQGSSLIVFDRWGKPVFESPAYENNWNGSGLSAGVYYWRAEGTCIKEAKGSISIVR